MALSIKLTFGVFDGISSMRRPSIIALLFIGHRQNGCYCYASDKTIASSGEDDDNESIESDEDYEELTTTAKPLPNPTKQTAFAVPPSPNNRNYIYFTYGKYVVSLLALWLPNDNSAILAQLVMNRTKSVATCVTQAVCEYTLKYVSS
jgi:hypothetical protein